MIDIEEIKKSAKAIIDSFSKALDKVDVKEARVERDEDRRIEKEGCCDEEFRNFMFSNAPKTKNECIEAEKGGWV